MAIAACAETQTPTDPSPETEAGATPVNQAEGFYFLPPIAEPSAPTGPLLTALAPFLTVELCVVHDDACASALESYTTREEGDHERLRVAGDQFQVNWHVSPDLDANERYRLRVRIGSMALGHVDVQIRQGEAMSTGALVVTPDSTVPVSFRVDDSPSWDLPSTLQLASDEVVTGQVAEVLGASPPEHAALELLVGGVSAPVRSLDGGSLMATVPLFLGSDSWPAPPEHAVDLMLLEDGRPTMWAREVVSVAAFDDAPGSAMEGLAHLTTVADAWEEFAEPAEGPSEEAAWTSAGLSALETLVNGDGPESLRAALEAAGPEERRLLDAWFAGSGVLEVLSATAELLEDVAASDDPAETSPMTAASIGDVGTRDPAGRLAKKMQFYEVAKLMGETVIGETSTEFGYVGLAAGAIGLVTNVPAASAVGAVLSVADFVVNKLLVGLLPAKIDELSLEIPNAAIAPGQQTIADARIQASNDPPAIGLLDIINQATTAAGLVGTPQAEDFAEVLIDVADYYRDVLQAALSAYAANHPDLGLNPTVASVPDMVWWAMVLDETLVVPRTLTPDLLTPRDDGIDWEAADDRFGEGRVYVQVNSGPEAMRLSPPAGITYTGGAFGVDIVQSEAVVVSVVGELVLDVSFADEIARDGFNVLEARAGYLDGDGNPVWTEDIAIELIVDGGTVEQTEGQTDPDGQFITLARLDEESDEIIITVTASDDTGRDVSFTVSASTEEENEPGSIEIDWVAQLWSGGAVARGESELIEDDDSRVSGSAGSFSGSGSFGASDAPASASAGVTHSSSVDTGEGDTLLVFTSNSAVSGSAQSPNTDNYLARGLASGDAMVGVLVVDNPVFMVAEIAGSGSGKWRGVIALLRNQPGENSTDVVDILYTEPGAVEETIVVELDPDYYYSFVAHVSAGGAAGTHGSADGATSVQGSADLSVTMRIYTEVPEELEAEANAGAGSG